MTPFFSNPHAQRFFTWARATLDDLCRKPDHLQRIAVMGAGVVMYPMVLLLIGIIWLGFGRHAELMAQQIQILGVGLYISMALWGLVVITMLGTIKGLKLDGPAGLGIELTTIADDPDVEPGSTRITTVSTTKAVTVPAEPPQPTQEDVEVTP